MVDLLAYEISLPSEFITVQCRANTQRAKLDTQDMSRGKNGNKFNEKKKKSSQIYMSSSRFYIHNNFILYGKLGCVRVDSFTSFFDFLFLLFASMVSPNCVKVTDNHREDNAKQH